MNDKREKKYIVVEDVAVKISKKMVLIIMVIKGITAKTVKQVKY